MTEVLGRDISISEGDIKFSTSQDFRFVRDRRNLIQAIFTRLQTIQGEYYVEFYGSELDKTIGNPRNENTRTQIIGYVGESLRQEPRIQSINNIDVEYPPEEENQVNIIIVVTPIDEQVPLNLIFPLFL